MAKKLFTVIVRWEREPKATVVEVELGKLGDWLRFSAANWLLWSELAPVDIYSALAKVLPPEDQELIFEADYSNYSGWAATWIDQWIISRRPS